MSKAPRQPDTHASPPRREVYENKSLLLNDLHMLGRDAPRTASDIGLSPHTHPDTFEICYIADGTVEWWVRNEMHQVPPGHVYITKPDEPHGGMDAVLHPCQLYWLQLQFGPKCSLAHMPAKQSRHLHRRLSSLERRCFLCSPTIPNAFSQLIHEHRRPDALSPLAARAALHSLLASILRDHDAAEQSQPKITPPIREACDYIQTHLDEDLPINTLAAVAGLSIAQFHHRFRCEVGFSPANWRNRQRIIATKKYLRDGKRSVTQIAFQLGYASSQYFATAFKRQVGLTPSAYQRNFRE